MPDPSPRLDDYVLLGRSGLRVSRLCLGTMTFGTEWGWGSAESAAREMFDRYLDAGGNFVDTADGYTGGSSESLVGKFIRDRGNRDRVVLATKFTFASEPGNPNSGGNGRKNIHRALEGSLRRLQTDYVDLYWLHAWDGLTPVDEVLSTLDGLVRAGKVRAIGFLRRAGLVPRPSPDHRRVPGLGAALRAPAGVLAGERNIEREHVPAALALGVGICPWSPLASGMLSGKYRRDQALEGQGRLGEIQKSGNPGFLKLFTDRNWQIVDVLVSVAKEMGRPPAQVALNWVARRPGVTSTILGATKPAQLDDNLAALSFELPEPLRKKLDEVTRPETVHPYHFFEPGMQMMMTGGTRVSSR